MAKAADFEPLASGIVCSIRVARNGAGECSARRQWDKLREDQRVALQTRFQATCDIRRIWPVNKLRPLGDGIYEFKTERPLMRALGFQEGDVWWITRIDGKPGKAALSEDIKEVKRDRAIHRESIKG